MKKILFISLFCAFQFALANGSHIDSLRGLINPIVSDTTQINIHINLSSAYIDINIDSTKHYALKAKKPSEDLNYTRGIIKINNLLGNCAQRKGDFDEAMSYYEIVKKISIETKDDKGMAIVLNNIGIIHTQRGEYNEALKDYLEAIDYEKKIGDKKGLAEGYNNVGVVHYYMGDMENTLVYLKKATEITEEIGDKQVLKKSYMNIGAIHLYNKEYKEAIEYYEKGLEISKELNDLSDITIAYHNLGGVYDDFGDYEKAEDYYLKALAFHEKFENKRGIALEFVNLGELLKNQKRYPKAKVYYTDALNISKEHGYMNIISSAYAGLAETNKLQGNFEIAYDNLVLHLNYKDSLLNEENAKSFAELRTKYETVEKEKALAEEKIKSESLAKEKAEAELIAANRKNWMLLFAALIIVAVLGSLVIMQKNKRKSQAEKDAAIIAERDKGTQAVFNAQEEERKRISKDLHDGVGQQLSGLKMAFQKLGTEIQSLIPDKSVEVENLSKILSESADEVRSISHQMMPKALTELGLIEAIEDMLNKSLGISKIDYQFEHFSLHERLSEKIEISLYRVAQELINNIIKHAKASHVSVQLFKNAGKIILVIEDNGLGIKAGENNGHGLLNIKSRVNTLNGEINLEPSPNSGTLATIRIPLS
ncbi:MAG: tetratricopeptide repeat protein [Bacteroidetes bacterium]|nr:MAG: tetratricopeptide repeat protein [Bacteroidota bacterium]MBL1143685.1 tetratricopeptide repeat protein [Bacteroidota bacterium]MCB0801837.1 tetratricopeptide repeat protein [Flavobacteriales bacterium]NOG56487.1 tetratricopeptide repeat protein [Bacteroidota bacterium]